MKNKQFFSNRPLHRERNGYCPTFFPQRKLTGDECKKLEGASWKIFFATRKILEVDEFLTKKFTMVTNINDYITDCNEFRNKFRDDLAEQFEHDLYNKFFSSEDKYYDGHTLQQRIDSWRTNINRGGAKPIMFLTITLRKR